MTTASEYGAHLALISQPLTEAQVEAAARLLAAVELQERAA